MIEADAMFILLHVSTIMIALLFFLVLRKRNRSQLHQIFVCTLGLQLLWSLSVIVRGYIIDLYPQWVIYTEYFTYIGVCFIPVALLLTGIIYVHTKVKITYKYYLLFIVPVLSLVMLLTNHYHGLFYEKYALTSSGIIFGKYFMIHTVYSYGCILTGLCFLVYFSIKNSGFFSKQIFMIIVGTLVPLIVNVLVTVSVLSEYITPISFSFAIMCYLFAIFKYDFLSISPVALQNVVDRISDSFLVLDENLLIIDFNKTFQHTFRSIADVQRNIPFCYVLDNSPLEKEKTDYFMRYIYKAKERRKAIHFQAHMNLDDFNKYFTIEITPIIDNTIFIGIIILLKDITQSVLDLKTIKQKQEILMEQERLASLGQLIGGIAHNMKTPIMSISGGLEALRDLVSEYDASIEDEEVTCADHHEIAAEMNTWIHKIKPYCSYMSDVISAVKGQAVYLSDSSSSRFTLGELLKRVEILMKHELKRFHCKINIHTEVDMDTEFKGEMNNLVQVFDNIIVNAIQAYGEKSGEIDLNITGKEELIVFSFKDYGPGIPKEVREKLFKEMYTTKGKHGTGLGLYMSYSTVKGRFNGDMWFESDLNQGTTFHISIPHHQTGTKRDGITAEEKVQERKN